jgi:hypothetical protein
MASDDVEVEAHEIDERWATQTDLRSEKKPATKVDLCGEISGVHSIATTLLSRPPMVNDGDKEGRDAWVILTVLHGLRTVHPFPDAQRILGRPTDGGARSAASSTWSTLPPPRHHRAAGCGVCPNVVAADSNDGVAQRRLHPSTMDWIGHRKR